VSIYDFQQSVEDGATVPLFYENRTPELELVNPELNEDIHRLIEEAELDPAQEEKLERELSRQYHLITRDDRLETVAADIVRHFLGRGFAGKAMVVSIDKATALRMHDKVRKHWQLERERVEREIKELYRVEPRTEAVRARARELEERLPRLKRMDMAVIVSPSQNEIEQMRQRGLEIVEHRQRMNGSQPPLEEKFKDPDDPLRLVFVCAMWLTGFDAPSCSTVYLDKPMRNHTLMQTIARANRVFPGKHSGVIVDYANVFASLEKALAIYGAGKDGGHSPVSDKSVLVEQLREAIAAMATFCAERAVHLAKIEEATAGSMEVLGMIEDAVNAPISPDDTRRQFFAHERVCSRLYGAIKPHPTAVEFALRLATVRTIADAIRAVQSGGPVNIDAIRSNVNDLLDESITGHEIPSAPGPGIDLSKIDFEALRVRFEKSRHQNTELEALKTAVRAQLDKLIRLNKTRRDFAERFEELIESYNAGSRESRSSLRN